MPYSSTITCTKYMGLQTISIGGATYDLFLRSSKPIVENHEDVTGLFLPLGEKIRIEDVIEASGGGACNTSVGLARLGLNAGFCGIIGSDQWGERLYDTLTKEQVNTDCITIVEGEVTSFSVVLSSAEGERVILYNAGTNEHLHDSVFDREACANTDWVYLNHIQSQSCVIQDDIIDALAKDESPRLSWNPGGCQIETGCDAESNLTLLAHTDLLLLNEEELHRFTKKTDLPAALQALHAVGVQNICVTQGSQGAYASNGHELYHCPAQNTKCIDTTGAGDAFGTAMTWALLHGHTLPKALQAGTINASSVVGSIGAQTGLLTETDMQTALETTTLTVSEKPLSSV